MKTRRRKVINTEWRVCDCGKRGHSSKFAARRSMRTAGNKIRVYSCPSSGLWHATSQLESWEDADFEK